MRDTEAYVDEGPSTRGKAIVDRLGILLSVGIGCRKEATAEIDEVFRVERERKKYPTFHRNSCVGTFMVCLTFGVKFFSLSNTLVLKREK